MIYNQLSEAIINVPNELLSKVNLYVSSVLAYKLRKYSERLDMLAGNNTSTDEKQKIQQDIKQTIAKLQQKYGARNITPETYEQLDGKNIKIDLDFDKFFKELNFKGITPEMIDRVKRSTFFELYILSGSSDAGGSVSNDGQIVRLMVHIGRLNGRDSLNTANAIMRTVYHECQHVVQDFAIKTIDNNKSKEKPNKQLSRNNNYDDAGEGYYTSGVEYTPQLGDVINTVNDILERDTMNGKLDKNINRAINNAISDAYQEDKTIRDFLGYTRKNNPDGYKKALKAIYSKVSPVYQSLSTKGVDYRYSDLDPEVLETNINVLATVIEMVRKKSKNFEIDGRKRGDEVKWITIYSIKEKWKLTIAPNGNNKYQVTFSYDGYDETTNLDSQRLLNFMGMITENTYYEAEDVLSILDSFTDAGETVTNEDAIRIKNTILDDAKHLKLSYSDKGGNNFEIEGINLSITPDEDNKNNLVLKNSSETLYFVLPPSKVIMLLQTFIHACVNNSNEAKIILIDFSSYIDKITRLRNI